MPFSWSQRCSLRLCRNSLAVLASVAVWARPETLRAQSIEAYFPSGVGGYDEQLGVTVQSRARPAWAPGGIDVGSFNVRPRVDQSLLYDSDPTGASGPGSWGEHTSASISAGSIWSRDGLGISLGIDDIRYFQLPQLDHTDWNAGLGAGYTIGDSALNVAYSHQSFHQLNTSFGPLQSITPGLDPTDTSHFQVASGIGTVLTETPILDQTDTAMAGYTFNLSRFSVTPNVSASSYRFGTATINGTPLNQQFLDHNTLTASVTTRYSMSDVGNLLVVLSGVDNIFTNQQEGLPTNNSKYYAVLGGADYQAKGVWRYRVLVGVQFATFEAPQFNSSAAPVIQASAVWNPTGLVTLTGTLTRSVQPPQSEGSNGFVLTSAGLIADYEFERNIIFQGRGSLQFAQYLQGGSQTNSKIGAGVSYLLNRNMRISLDYDYTQQSATTVTTSNASNPNTVTTGEYKEGLGILALHVAF